MKVTLVLPGKSILTHEELEVEETEDGIIVTVQMQALCEALATFYANTAEIMQAMQDGLIEPKRRA